MGFELGGKSAGGNEDLSGELLEIITDIRQKLRGKKNGIYPMIFVAV